MNIVLPFPPSSLSGHNNGAWYNRDKIVATYRAEAFHLTKSAKRVFKFEVPDTGDVQIHFRFVPPDRRSDRTNMPGRLKAQIDGIAEALGINDRRFLPSYEFSEPQAPGRVEVTLLAVDKYRQGQPLLGASGTVEQKQAEQCPTTARPTPETLDRSATDAA